MLEGAAWVVKTWGVIYTEHLLSAHLRITPMLQVTTHQIKLRNRGGMDGR